MADHLESLARGRPVSALSELIWNALDADATLVEVEVEDNDIDTPSRISVIDNGTGIPIADATNAFGHLGGSWKKERSRTSRNDKRLHGRDGKGRFKAFAIGRHVSWNTTYLSDAGPMTYQIYGRSHDLQNFSIGVPQSTSATSTGTIVEITGIDEPFGIFAHDGSALQQLNEQFAIYLRDYPTTTIRFRGQRVDPKGVQRAATTIALSSFVASTGEAVDASLEVIEWNFAKKERKLCLCDAGGFMLHEIEAGIRPGADYNFTAYVKSEYIASLHDQNALALDELNPDLARLVDDARGKLRGYFRQRKAETARELVDEWKKEGIYPYTGDAPDAVERARREVFDICAISVNDYLDSFRAGSTKDRKFTLRMIRTAVDENPTALKKILTELLDLPKEKQTEFAELLEQTSLSAIIEASKTVSERLRFIAGFRELIFHPDSKPSLKERKQLHRILEGETWLFGEEYLLTNSDENLEPPRLSRRLLRLRMEPR
jgi:pentatricopeptide repeat protein